MINGEGPHTPDAAPHANGAAGVPEPDGPARALTLHLLRMLETRMDAAGIAINTEVQTFSSRMQLRLLAAGALFIAIWGAIVLLAVALPEPYRVPVLAVVVLLFAGGAAWAQWQAKKKLTGEDVGSMRWFLDGLRLDFEVLSRVLAHRHDPAPGASPPGAAAPPRSSTDSPPPGSVQ
ncbi:MAG TPA: hypothetical protein VMF52_21555 [Steroidobacteraceae bacterium]|nr:hypothetical protein [Steroidobacteraceae bacterium]